MEAKTYRMRGHGEYDHQHYVDKKELEEWAGRSPILKLEEKLLAEGMMEKREMENIGLETQRQIEAALKFADESPYPLPTEALDHLWA